jgi:hypothetical protein
LSFIRFLPAHYNTGTPLSRPGWSFSGIGNPAAIRM